MLAKIIEYWLPAPGGFGARGRAAQFCRRQLLRYCKGRLPVCGSRLFRGYRSDTGKVLGSKQHSTVRVRLQVLSCAEEAIKLDPTCYKALYRRGCMLAKKNNLEEATSELNKALEHGAARWILILTPESTPSGGPVFPLDISRLVGFCGFSRCGKCFVLQGRQEGAGLCCQEADRAEQEGPEEVRRHV